MSEIMLGVLEMPDDLFWSDETMARYQHNQIRKEAAAELRKLQEENDAMRRMLEYSREAIASQPIDAFGDGQTPEGQTYPIRDELTHDITKALSYNA